MDIKNRFHTNTTFNLVRLDYLALLILCITLLIQHHSQINWWIFFIAIAWQDIFGYYPAAAIYYILRKGELRNVPKPFYIVYNFTHSTATNVLALGLWVWFIGGWDWAMLALPIHICIDRSIVGNIYKPFALSFEPKMHPSYEKFTQMFSTKMHWGTPQEGEASLEKQ